VRAEVSKGKIFVYQFFSSHLGRPQLRHFVENKLTNTSFLKNNLLHLGHLNLCKRIPLRAKNIIHKTIAIKKGAFDSNNFERGSPMMSVKGTEPRKLNQKSF
jgi:hypothetical protein